MRRIPALLSVMLGVAGVFIATTASAERIRYQSAHPIPASVEGNFCYIDLEHTHTYTPEAEAQPNFLRQGEGGGFEFVGDPSQWGYEGPLISYTDTHPFHFEGGSADAQAGCQIEGAHFHLHAPHDASQYEERSGSFYFGSYKAVMELRREKASLRKAEEREERRQKRKKRRRSRSKKKRSSRSSSSSTSRSVVKTTVTQPTVKKKKKPAKKSHRSWMDRRRGR